MIKGFMGKSPVIAADAFLAENSVIIGSTAIGSGSSVWYGAVIRGDYGVISIGKNTNIQDNCVVHGTVTIGDNVTVGHAAIVHSCIVEDDAIIGMGAILMDGCVIGKGSVVAAGALVTKGKVFPPYSMIMGSPAKQVRTLTEEEIEYNKGSAASYLERAQNSLVRQPGREECGGPGE